MLRHMTIDTRAIVPHMSSSTGSVKKTSTTPAPCVARLSSLGMRLQPTLTAGKGAVRLALGAPCTTSSERGTMRHAPEKAFLGRGAGGRLLYTLPAAPHVHRRSLGLSPRATS